MTDRNHDNLNAKARAIVDDAIAELYLLGLESRDAAAGMMAIQAICRIEEPDQLAMVAKFAADSIPEDE